MSAEITHLVGAAAAVAATHYVLGVRLRAKTAAAPKVCIASCRELIDAGSAATASYGSTGADENHLYQALNASNIDFDVRAWDDQDADWSRYAAIFVRTTWDYSTSEVHASRFRAWLSQLCDIPGMRVYNDPRILSWNVHKEYLSELSRFPLGKDGRGRAVGRIPTIPSVYVPAGCPPGQADLTTIAKEQGWRDMLIKPCVGGGSRGCMRVLVDREGSMAEGQAFLTRHVRPMQGGATPSNGGQPQQMVSPTATAALPRLQSGRMGASRSVSPSTARMQASKLATAAAAAATMPDVTAEGADGEQGGTPAAGFPHGVVPCDLRTDADGHVPGSHDVAHLPCDMMVQPYIGSVEDQGELSVIVIDGHVTHTVTKCPAPGDYRTQEEHGGSPRPRETSLSTAELELVHRVLATAGAAVEAQQPPLGTHEGACSPAHRDSMLPLALASQPEPLMVARCDFLRLTPAVAASLGPVALARAGLDPTTTPLLLLELEAIEPCLFLGVDRADRQASGKGMEGGAAARLVQAIQSRIQWHADNRA